MSNSETQVSSSNDAEVVESQRLTGDRKEEDVFAHHSGITVDSEQYKYLVQGEYVTFDLRKSDNQEHPYQAGNIRGVEGGPLMCETRLAMRKSSQDGEEKRQPRSRRQQRPRGTGPREGRGNWQVEDSQRSRRGNRRQQQQEEQ